LQEPAIMGFLECLTYNTALGKESKLLEAHISYLVEKIKNLNKLES